MGDSSVLMCFPNDYVCVLGQLTKAPQILDICLAVHMTCIPLISKNVFCMCEV